MSIQRVVFNVIQTSNAADIKVVDLPTPADGITYDWIVQSLKDAFSQFTAHVVELKYEDDEQDLITFSSQHEVLEAITVAEAAQQETFRVFATVVTEPKVMEQTTESHSVQFGAEAKSDSDSASGQAGLGGIFSQIAQYLSSLSESARESIADAMQVGIQQLKELGDPKQALLDTLAMFPESPSFDVKKIVAEVKKVSAEQWEQAKSIVKKIPEQTWAMIEQSVPQIMNFFKMFGRNGNGASGKPFGGNPFASMFGQGFGSPASTSASTETGAPAPSSNPFASFAQFAPFLGMMSMMNGGRMRPEEQKGSQVEVEVTSIDELIQVAEPGMHVVRTWSVKNVGAVALPEGVQVRAVDDPSNLASEMASAVTLPRLNPGESTEVSQLLQAPQAEGAYNAVYALKTLYGSGPSIGPDLPVELLVTEAY